MYNIDEKIVVDWIGNQSLPIRTQVGKRGENVEHFRPAIAKENRRGTA